VEWTLDASHSSIGFVARHLGFSKASGQFKKFAAVVKADPKTAKLSSLEATAETASIDTGIEKRDAHLRSDDFLNAEKFPQLKLVTKSIKWNGNKFTAQVDLTIRDVTKTVPFKGELLGVHQVNFGQGPQMRAGYEASATINRKDFGLKWSMVTEGLSVVADPVQIELAAELSYTPPATTAAAATPAPAAATAAAAKVETTTTAAQAAAAKLPASPAAAHAAAPAAPTAPKAPTAPAAPAAPKVAPPTAPTATK
jgi:polyisoprenoid-binding protein YceI